MADLDRRYAQGTTVGRTDAGVVDQGLRAYMIVSTTTWPAA